MFIVNTDLVPGMEITKVFGIVQGSTVRLIIPDLRPIGGELMGCTKLLKDARNEAMQRMVGQAKKLGANAILGVRYETTSFSRAPDNDNMLGMSELFCYGTAVLLEPVS